MRTHQAWLGLVSSLVLLSSHGFASAQIGVPLQSDPSLTPASPPAPSVLATESQPHTGVHLGAHVGIGELRFRFGEYSLWGRTFPIEAWAGISLSRNLVLFGEFYDAHVFNPSSSYGELTDLNLLGFGPGLKYYLTPTDIYVSASLLLSRISFDNDVSDSSIDEHTRWGATGRLAVGRDWQMSRGWRFGLEGDVYFGRMNFDGLYGSDDQMGTARGFSLLASASYNYEPVPHTPINCKGLHLEARIGAGRLWTGSGEHAISGTSLPLGLWIGTALTRRLVLYGALTYAHVFSPTSGSPSLHAVDFYGFGPGVKYYIASTNVFLSGALLLSQLRIDDDESYYVQHTHWGLSADISLGREFWLSHHWGLGIAGNLLLGKMSKGDDGTDTTKGLSLLALATYNQGPDLCCAPDKRNIYLEARVGGGHLWTRFGGDSASGGSYQLGLSTGWAVTRRLVLLGDFSIAHLPSLTSDFYPGLESGNFYAAGPRAKYYITSTSIFLSGALHLTRIDFTHQAPFDIMTTHWGLSTDVSFGKEWWLSEHWAMGVAGDFLLGRMSAGQFGMHTTKGLSVLALATFNYPKLTDDLFSTPLPDTTACYRPHRTPPSPTFPAPRRLQGITRTTAFTWVHA
jgi:hypothetical protein